MILTRSGLYVYLPHPTVVDKRDPVDSQPQMSEMIFVFG